MALSHERLGNDHTDATSELLPVMSNSVPVRLNSIEHLSLASIGWAIMIRVSRSIESCHGVGALHMDASREADER